MEEGDIEREQLQELEEEVAADTKDRELEALTGIWVPFNRTVTGRDTGMDDREIKKLLASKKSLHKIPTAKRGDVYRYFIKKLNREMKRSLRVLFEDYQKATKDLQFARVFTPFSLVT
jgi:hypothetical protein